eukprot:TRINITY_DN7462_c0_g1_i1.p1 TRINITY_DN7462_c0_g1~~TRINITY_DN7462_c0_g1_i1.p1  ORF type:complete len:545 (+),score=240.27 TRINITY_DN7462_c0_g1_i1:424-2058(+)
MLYSYKINNPKTFFLLRGNHECLALTTHFTFKRECIKKYNEQVWDAAIESFRTLPLSAVVDNKYFCVHGGISPQLHSLKDIATINRVQEPPMSGIMCDLLWADPCADYNEPIDDQAPFIPNQVRGCSVMFSYEAVRKFLAISKLQTVIRAHEAQQQGYQMYRATPKGNHSVITLFSAPNYLNVYNNKAAIILCNKAGMVVKQFDPQPAPYCLPAFHNAFTWSIPFVAEKVGEILLFVLAMCAETYEDDLTENEIEKSQQNSEMNSQITTINNSTFNQNDITNVILDLHHVATAPVESNNQPQIQIQTQTQTQTQEQEQKQNKIQEQTQEQEQEQKQIQTQDSTEKRSTQSIRFDIPSDSIDPLSRIRSITEIVGSATTSHPNVSQSLKFFNPNASQPRVNFQIIDDLESNITIPMHDEMGRRSTTPVPIDPQTAERRTYMKRRDTQAKLIAAQKMVRSMSLKRMNNVAAAQLGGLADSIGASIHDPTELIERAKAGNFETVKELDRANEMMPATANEFASTIIINEQNEQNQEEQQDQQEIKEE